MLHRLPPSRTDKSVKRTFQWRRTRACSSGGPLESSCKRPSPPASPGTGCFLQRTSTTSSIMQHCSAYVTAHEDSHHHGACSSSASNSICNAGFIQPAGRSRAQLIQQHSAQTDEKKQRRYKSGRGITALTGNVTQGEDFPKQDPVGPHVTLKGVDAVKDALGGHPLHGQTSLQRRETSVINSIYPTI